MKTKKRILLSMLLAATVATFSAGVASCIPEPDTQDHGAVGLYYVDVEGGEYQIALSDDTYTMLFGDEVKTGTYTYDGSTFKMYESETELNASFADGVLTLNYNGGSYRFVKKVTYTVTYNTNGGSQVGTASVINGRTLKKPEDPVKTGYTFIGWYTDEAFTTPFAFDATPVTADLTLYARYAAQVLGNNEYTVNFVVDGENYASKKTVEGVVYNAPTPEKDGAKFAGWWTSDYQDAQKLTAKYEGQALAQNTTLYAVWESDTPQISVTSKGVSWSTSKLGSNYTVSIKNSVGEKVASQTSTSTDYAFDFASKAAGDYTVEVSVGGVTSTAYYRNKALARVSLFTVAEPSVLVFNRVENAEKYIITVDCGDDAHAHQSYDNGTSTNFNFVNCVMQEGGITFTVQAIANGYASSVSETYTYSRDLNAVTNLTYDAAKGEIIWDAVEKASAYQVEITNGDTTYKTSVNTTKYSVKGFSGEVTVKVTAVAAGHNSADAAELTYTSAKLAAPTNVRVDYGVINWNAVEGATKYNLMIGSKLYEATETSLEIPEEYLASGTAYTIAVQAAGATEDKNSFYSDAINVKNGELETVLYKDGVLAWNSMADAYRYGVKVNNSEEVKVTGDKASTEVTLTKSGENVVTLYAYDFLGRVIDEAEVKVVAKAVIFDVQGGAAIETQYKAVGDKITLPQPTLEGYQFGGWYNVPGGSMSNGAKYEAEIYQGTGDMVLYAYWIPNAYEVTLMVGKVVKNETTGETEIVYEEYGKENVYYQGSFKLPTPASNDATQTFGGWYAEANNIGRKYTDAHGASAFNWDHKEGKVLYAGWINILGYELINNGTAYQVVKGEGIDYVKEVTIPSSYTDPVTGETKPVTAIAASAFYNCDNLITINIPETIESIFIGLGGATASGSAFYSCGNLQAINVYCENEAEHERHETYFSSIDGVLIRHNTPQVPLEKGVELYFMPQGKTGSYTVPDIIQNIPSRTFYGSRVSEIIIPSSVTSVGSRAFQDADSATRIVFLETPEGEDEKPLTIDSYAFTSCGALKSVTFPARLNELDIRGLNLFYNTLGLTEINVVGEDGFYTSNDGVLCSADGSEIIYCPTGRSGEYTVPVEIQKIGARAFEGCTKITKLIVKDNVQEIGVSAFSGCTQLSVIDFQGEDGVLDIKSKAFYGCSTLRQVTLPKNLKSLGQYAFGNTQQLYNVTLNCTTDLDLAFGAFADEDGVGYVKGVAIGADTEAFEINGVFNGCAINSVQIDKNNPNYETDAQGVLYNKGQTKLLFYPFGQTGNYTIPSTVTEISAGVFEGKTNITEITIGKNVTFIGASAFADSINLKTVIFEGGRTEALEIGASAFAGCLSLEEIELPEMLTKLGNNAFENCKELTSISLPATLAQIGDGGVVSMEVFKGCDALAELTVAAGNEHFVTMNGLFYGKTEGVVTDLYYVPANVQGKVVIPNTVKLIADRAFYGNTGITEIAFEDNVVTELTIGDYAFASTVALKKVILPAGLTAVPERAFSQSSVEEVFVPNSVTEVGFASFYKAEKLATLTFEATEEGSGRVLKFLGLQSKDGTQKMSGTTSAQNYGMFYGTAIKELIFPEGTTDIPDRLCSSMTSLEKVTIPSTVTRIGVESFRGTSALKSVTFAKNAEGQRSLTTFGYWTFYLSGLETLTVPSSLTTFESSSMGANTFKDNKNLKTVVFEDGCMIISSAMFEGCISLTSVTIPDSVSTINAKAFAGCTKLTTLDLPASLVEIPANLFGTAVESITIPASVKKINAQAFDGCTGLKEIIFEAGSQIEEIGDYAFRGTAITEFVLPENASASVTTLGLSIFANCTKLETVSLPKTVANLNNAFAGCGKITNVEIATDSQNFMVDATNLIVYNKDKTAIRYYYGKAEEFVVPETVEEIGIGAFAGNTSLKKVTIPAGVRSIGDYAFDGCTNLSEVVLDAQLTSLGSYAFAKTGITSITLPATLNVPEAEDAEPAIGDYAFAECASLKSVTVNGTAMGSYMFYKCTALTDVNLSDNITSFSGFTFQGCSSLVGIDLPSNLTNVWGFEFAECTKLESIVLPETLKLTYGGSKNSTTLKTQIDYNYHGVAMFYKCSSLKSITLSDSVEEIPGAFLEECRKLESIKLPSNLRIIGQNAFYYCESVTELTFPASLETVYYYDNFSYMKKLKKLDFSHTQLGTNPTGNSSSYFNGRIGYFCFRNCTALEEVIFPDTVTVLKYDEFTGCTNLKTVIAPGVIEVGYYNNSSNGNLNGRTKLETVVLSPNLAKLNNNAFYGCTALKEFNFPDTLTSIGNNAFANSGLESINLSPSSVLTTIGASAFQGCPITTAYIPATVTSIGNGAFSGCSKLVSFDVDPANPNYQVGMAGELYDAINTLIAFPAGASGDNGYVALDAGVTLNSYAFQGCMKIKAIELPIGLRDIPEGLFYQSGVQRVVIPAGVRSIGTKAFAECKDLEAVLIPSSVTSIDTYAFQNCVKLAEIELPNVLTQIANYTFSGCTSLTSINFPKSLETIGAQAFANSGLTSVEMGNQVKTIQGSAFLNCTALTTVKLSANLETMAQAAFKGTGITEITIPASVRVMGTDTNDDGGLILRPVGGELLSQTFMDCKSLTTVVFEGAPEIIQGETFIGCTALENVTFNGEWKTIATKMFKGCTALTSITLPETLTTIEKCAFLSSGLTSVVIPNSVTEIQASAFEDCNALASVTLSNQLETIGAFAFSKSAIESIVIPASVKKLGSADKSALDSSSSGSTGGSVKPGVGGILKPVLPGIGGGTTTATETSSVFLNCTSLKTVVFEGVPTTMQGDTFKGCTALESVTLADGWTTIEKGMFSGCTKLTNLELPATVTTIGANAFQGWKATQTIKVNKTQAEAEAAWGKTWFGSATVVYSDTQTA